MRRKCLMMPKAYVNMDSEESDSRGGYPDIVVGKPYMTSITSSGEIFNHYSISVEEEGFLVNTRWYGPVIEHGNVWDNSLVQVEKKLSKGGKFTIILAIEAAGLIASSCFLSKADEE